MGFLLIFAALEVLSFISDYYLINKMKLPSKDVFLVTQAVIFFSIAFLPLIGFPLVSVKKGEILVEDAVVTPAIILSLACIFLLLAKKIARKTDD